MTSSLPDNWQSWLVNTLAARDCDGLRRAPASIDSMQATRVQRDGQWLANFCSNDYLGLAAEPALQDALIDAVRRVGVGAGSASLVCGHHREHAALSEELADWLGVEAVLLFGNGYLANLGVLTGLAGRGDAIVQDRLNHASLIDGAMASGAKHLRYAHADASAAEQRFASLPESISKRVLVSDGVFSMDGDIAPVADLVVVAKRQQALFILDEAHAFGVIGSEGRGSVSHATLANDAVPLRIGTLGKAFGVYGAFAAGPRVLIDALQQLARPAIYTTALPPALAAVTRVALKHVRNDQWRRDQLQANIAQFRTSALAQGWQLMSSETAIQPILIGDTASANALSAELLARGFWVSSIRPPTVPVGSARLRVTLSSAHSSEAIAGLLNALAELTPRFLSNQN
ncbi:8-amino-7-oxononanoate synthase [Paraperlucidibaca sp.]|uniref:aminotransferase class I/II-fold pyridoxal phosphate-dependent enzyme n=1 Tax=Paraperlucidibaca sp. TaxID=2708021 RepID=UPI0030F39A45